MGPPWVTITDFCLGHQIAWGRLCKQRTYIDILT